MPLLPLNDTIFGEMVSDGGLDDLAQMVNEATAEFRESLGSLAFDSESSGGDRALEASLKAKKQIHFLARVSEVGPDVREVQVGDTVVLPPYGGQMITVIQGGVPVQRFCIREKACLATWREED